MYVPLMEDTHNFFFSGRTTNMGGGRVKPPEPLRKKKEKIYDLNKNAQNRIEHKKNNKKKILFMFSVRQTDEKIKKKVFENINSQI